MLGLPKILFRTFILSLVVGIAVTCIWYATVHDHGGENYVHDLPTIVLGAIYFNAILLVMSLPALFLANTAVRNTPVVKLLLYFTGPIAVIITAVFAKNSETTRTFYLILACVYTLIHTFYYIRVVGKLGQDDHD
jgi:hypothetical protein